MGLDCRSLFTLGVSGTTIVPKLGLKFSIYRLFSNLICALLGNSESLDIIIYDLICIRRATHV